MVAKPAALWHSKAAARVFCPVCRLTLLGCGCSSGVEHNLAKVGVEGSNPFARSKIDQAFSRKSKIANFRRGGHGVAIPRRVKKPRLQCRGLLPLAIRLRRQTSICNL